MKISVWLAVTCLLIGAQSQAQAQNASSDTSVHVDDSRLYTPMNSEDQDTMSPEFGGPGGGHPGGGGGFGPHPGPGGGGGFGPHPGPGPMPHPGPGPGPMPHPGPGPGPMPHPGPGPGPMPHPGPGPGPMPHPGPGPGPMPHPGPGHGPWGGHPGWHPGGPRPGWHNGWGWDYNHHPGWWYGGITFPGFVWATQVPHMWYQCTAFDSDMNAYSATAPDVNEAAYDALYDCGGADYADECYIPSNYCEQYVN